MEPGGHSCTKGARHAKGRARGSEAAQEGKRREPLRERPGMPARHAKGRARGSEAAQEGKRREAPQGASRNARWLSSCA